MRARRGTTRATCSEADIIVMRFVRYAVSVIRVREITKSHDIEYLMMPTHLRKSPELYFGGVTESQARHGSGGARLSLTIWGKGQK